MLSLLENVKQLLNLGVGDIGRLEHIKSSLEENKKLYSSDMNYVEKMIEQHIGNQDIVEQPHEIKPKPAKNLISDNHVEVINRSPKKGIFSKKKNYECPECNEKFAKHDELANHGQTIHNQSIKNCSLCKSSFFYHQSMMEHTKEKHHKVHVGWQVLFIFLPIIGIWAYYRIKRLGDGILLSFGLSGLLYGGVFLMFLIGWATDPNYESDLRTWLLVLSVYPLLGVIIWLKIHYGIKWSREWNKKIHSQMESTSKEEFDKIKEDLN